MQTKIPEKVSRFFKDHGSVLDVTNGEIWCYYPYWIKMVKDSDVVEIVSPEHLPEEVKQIIKDQRNEL